MSCTKVSTVVLVAASDFATDSVEGQRGRPSAVIRFDLLKGVGSSPAFLASPEADSPARAARRSTAFQISEWVNIWRCATAVLRCVQVPNRATFVGIKTKLVHILVQDGENRLVDGGSARFHAEGRTVSAKPLKNLRPLPFD